MKLALFILLSAALPADANNAKIQRFLELFDAPPLEFRVRNPMPVQRGLGFLSSAYQVQIRNKALAESVMVPVISSNQFLEEAWRLRGKGMWYLFSLSDGRGELLTGHGQIAVGNHLHTRSGVEGIFDLETLPLESNTNRLIGASARDFVVAQFLELSDEAAAWVDDYFKQRVYFKYFSPDPLYQIPFRFLPHFAPGANTPLHPAKIESENCNGFCWSYFYDYWRRQRPDIERSGIHNELGTMRIAQSPAMQVFLNQKSVAHRATYLVTYYPESLEAGRWGEEFYQTKRGAQLYETSCSDLVFWRGGQARFAEEL